MITAISDDTVKQAANFFKVEADLQHKPAKKQHDVPNPFDFEAYLGGHDKQFKQRTNANGKKYKIQCPFNPGHGEDAAVWQCPDGKLAFKCFHAGCVDNHWPEFRAKISGDDPLKKYFDDQNQGGGFTDSADVSCEDIPDPIPFDNFSSLPEFPLDSLPECIGKEMVLRVSEVNQIDPAFTACCYLGALSTAALGKYSVDMGTHQEYENVFLIGILNSGERKSPTVAAITKPLYDYQKAVQDQMKPEISIALNGRKIKEAKIKDLQSRAAKECDPLKSRKLTTQAADIALELVQEPEPALPVLIVDDVTPEKLGELMAANGETMALISPEGGIFDILAGRYSSDGKGNIDLYLKAYSHDPFSSHRIGRGAVSMSSPSLTICLGVQPSVVMDIGKNERFRGKGLMARCLFAYCQPHAGHRTWSKDCVPRQLTVQYHEFILSLAERWTSAPFVLRLSNAAQDIWRGFFDDVEIELRPTGSLYQIQDWGNKLPGGVARIAGLLHFGEYRKESVNHQISGDIVGRACVIGLYFREHARAVFGLMAEPPEAKTAKIILDFISRMNSDKFKAREIFNHTNLKSMAEIEPGLKLLCERSYIIMGESERTHRIGRPAATEYTVNPKFKK